MRGRLTEDPLHDPQRVVDPVPRGRHGSRNGQRPDKKVMLLERVDIVLRLLFYSLPPPSTHNHKRALTRHQKCCSLRAGNLRHAVGSETQGALVFVIRLARKKLRKFVLFTPTTHRPNVIIQRPLRRTYGCVLY